jgi:hypothetical protein
MYWQLTSGRTQAGGLLAALIDGTGPASAAHLRRIAVGEVKVLNLSTSMAQLLADA